MTYVAKPACPGTANESRSAPLCCITVRIGEEAFVKRRISESDLIRDEGGASCTEGAEGEHQPRVRRRRRRRRRRRSDGYSLGQDSEDEDSDREDNLWRPYYSYKPKRRAPGSLHRPRRVGWHRRLRYRPPPPGTPPPACPPPPPSATEGTHHQCEVPGDGDLPAVPGIPREGLWPPSPRGPADTDGDPSPRANGRRTLAGRHLGNRLAKTDPSAPAGGGSRPLGEGEEGAGTSRPDLRTRLPTIGVDPDAAVSCPSPREVTVAQPAHGEGKRTAEPRGGESVMDARGRLLAPTCPAPADWEPLRDTGMASKNRLVQDGTGPAHRTLVPEDGESRALGTLDTGGPYPHPQMSPCHEGGGSSPGNSRPGAEALVPQEGSHHLHTLEPAECRRAGTGPEFPLQEYPIPLLTNGNCCPHSKIPCPERAKPAEGGLSKVTFYQDPYPLMYGHQLLTSTYPYPFTHVSPLPLALNMVIRDNKAQHLPLLQRMFVYPSPCLGDTTPLGTGESGGCDEAGGRELVTGQKDASLY
ncbi:hypothetical protein chiPu_0023539 [Chiloscyllium punctatum]|uniref:Uncharacterized protein n=1 Tax=Chiloscyllium punctatum TaxID=137246 RepID=A0A401TAH5_CHIPU|nr:hypothetical protein [Chiloscyllium punctatum]